MSHTRTSYPKTCKPLRNNINNSDKKGTQSYSPDSKTQLSQGQSSRGRGTRNLRHSKSMAVPPDKTRIGPTRSTGFATYNHDISSEGVGTQNSRLTERQTSDSNSAASGGNAPTGSQVQRRDAYTVITPDEKKRQAILSKARKGEDDYTRHREKQRVQHVSYCGTPGGNCVSEVSVRNKAQMTQRQADINRRLKSQQYRDETKRRENEEIEKKRAEQRRKAEQNEERETRRQENQKQSHLAKKEASLARLESKPKRKQGDKILASSAAKSGLYSQQEEGIEFYEESRMVDACGETRIESATWIPDYETEQANEESIVKLVRIFPGCDRTVLEEVLTTAGGDVDKALSLLT